MSNKVHEFVFMTCRRGAERAVKHEVARLEPQWRFSFSRPGFLTFKNIGEMPLDPRRLAERNWTFAHAHGISLGGVTGGTLEELAAQVWHTEGVAALAPSGPADLHVWRPGYCAEEQDDEEDVPLFRVIEEALRAAAPESCARLKMAYNKRRRPAPRNGRVLDVMVLQPGEWWLGYHYAVRRHERWPGGCIPVRFPSHAVSRAYVKMEEALQWSDLPLKAGEVCVEIGCAPGGASQALLDRGLLVIGIDPADVHPTVLAHPRFRHLKKRGKDVRRKEFAVARWLAADMNIAPQATLDEVEAIVTHPDVAIRGMVLTLKFSDWSLAARLPELVQRVRQWRYRDVRTRQLVTGGQEVCLVALRRKELRRLGRAQRGMRQSRNLLRKDTPHSAVSGPHF